jgi:hypothetical protein
MSRAIRLKGRIGQPAAAETPSSRVRGFDPGLTTRDGPWWGPADWAATLDNTEGQLSGDGLVAVPLVPPEHARCTCGHKGKAHRNYWSTSQGRGVWACTAKDANATCACTDFDAAAMPDVPPAHPSGDVQHAKQHIEGSSPGSLCACGHKRHAHTRSGLTANSRSWCTLCDCKEYKYGVQAKLEIAAANFTTSMASFGGTCVAAIKHAAEYDAALAQVRATLRGLEDQAFIQGKPLSEKQARVKDLMDMAIKYSAETGQPLAAVIDGMRAMGAFD